MKLSFLRLSGLAIIALTLVNCGRSSFVEIDKMTGADFPLATIDDGGTMRSMASIFAEGDLTLDVRNDDANRPPRGSWSDAELHACMLAWKNSAYAESGSKWSSYILVTVGESTTWGSGTLGVMFDNGAVDVNGAPREGCAVFWDEHDGMANHDEEIFLTSVHELNHVFNSHHSDWEGGSFGSNSTVEGYSFTDTVVWGISTMTENHLRDHPLANVKPGASGVDFGIVTADHAAAHH